MQQLLNQCLKLGAEVASRDLHFIPEVDGVLVMRRLIDNRMEALFVLERERFEQLSRYLKFQTNLQLGVRLLQCGQFQYEHQKNQYNLRCSFVPTPRGESLVMRLLDQSAVRTCAQLTPISLDQQVLAQLALLEQGLIVFSGPTGVGKTTTLYALIEACKLGGKSIISLEDPVERQLYGVTQVQVQEHGGLAYEAALQMALRHDPDVIVIGEIRSEYVMEMAKRAALTGHLVIATLHSGSVQQCFARLDDLGIKAQDLRMILQFISSQQLVCVDQQLYGIYEYLTAKQLKDWFMGKEVEYERLAEKKQKVYTQANYV